VNAAAEPPPDENLSLGELRAERDRLEKELSILREALLAERRDHRLTRSHFQDLNRQITEVFDSTSWKAGAPIRVLGTVRRRMPVVPHLVGALNRRRVSTLWRLLRQGDLTTIRQRLTVVGNLAVPSVRVRHHQTVTQERWPSEDPLVSVVVICFNYGRFVAEAVESVLRQTAPRLEVIVVDGGSDDSETVDVLRDLAETWPSPVRVLYRDGRHLVGDNRNFGIAHARGKYICCLDADDRLAPVYLEVALFLLENYGYDLVSTSIGCFGDGDEIYGVLPFPDLDDMMRANNVSTVGVFRRADWVRSGGSVDTGLAGDYTYEDWRLWMRLAALGARIANIEQPLFHYRRHGVHSISNQSGSVVDMTVQREAILAHNDDVLTAGAVAKSRRRKETEIEVVGGTVNLVPTEADHRFTVLVTFPFFLVGGAERLISGVIRYLRDQGIRVVVVTTVRTAPDIDGDSADWFTEATDEVFQLPLLLEQRRWADFVRYLIVSRRVDVLWQVGSEYIYQLLPELKMEFPSLVVVDQLFNTGVHAHSNRRQRPWIDVTLVESEEVEQWLVEHGDSPDRIRRIGSAVDTSLYVPRPTENPADEKGPLVVGYSGRISEEKGPDLFVDLAAALRHREVRVVMTGAGPMEASTRRRAGRLKLDAALEFRGVVSDIAGHLRQLDVLVLPSRQDGRPVVVLEALASGVPVVASRLGGIPEMVQDGSNGFLCPAGDVDALAACVDRLIADRQLLATMKANARRYAVDHLDAGLMNARYLAALKERTPTSTPPSMST
jgi:glycosyltransferase involved in cell wall biosynthesis